MLVTPVLSLSVTDGDFEGLLRSGDSTERKVSARTEAQVRILADN